MLAQRTALFKSSNTAAAWTAANAVAASADQIIDLTAEEIRSDLAPMVREGTIIAINHNINRPTEIAEPTVLRHALALQHLRATLNTWN